MWLDLAKRTRLVNGANGWEAPTWEKLLNKLMLTVTELDEAVRLTWRMTNAYDAKEESFGVELADTAIRLLDILESIWPEAWSERSARLLNESHQVVGDNLFKGGGGGGVADHPLPLRGDGVLASGEVHRHAHRTGVGSLRDVHARD